MERPTKHDLLAQDRNAAIDEALGDCASVARLMTNELARDAWNVPGDDVETLQFLVRKMAENLQELEARIAS